MAGLPSVRSGEGGGRAAELRPLAYISRRLSLYDDLHLPLPEPGAVPFSQDLSFKRLFHYP